MERKPHVFWALSFFCYVSLSWFYVMNVLCSFEYARVAVSVTSTMQILIICKLWSILFRTLFCMKNMYSYTTALLYSAERNTRCRTEKREAKECTRRKCFQGKSTEIIYAAASQAYCARSLNWLCISQFLLLTWSSSQALGSYIWLHQVIKETLQLDVI